jgi:4-amino-4-deoxy-L-arabinose transferase-like glycosyltransferase
MVGLFGMRRNAVIFTAFLALLAWFLYFQGASSAGLIGPDEPRYAQVSREMLRNHDWITPYLHGEPWFEKPPLYYWLTAAAFAVFGLTEAAARLPAALFAVGFVILFAWQTRRLFPGETTRYAVPILLSSLGWIAFGRAATMEMMFSALLAGSLGFMALWLWQGRRRWLFAFHGLLALTVLSKGFGGVALAALILGVYCVVTQEFRWLLRVLNPWAVTLFSVIALPWLAAMQFKHGHAFFDEFIVRQHFRRYVSSELAHPGPWWFYLPILLVGMFPWTAHLGLLRFRGIMRDHRRVFLLCWVATVLAFFSASQGKLSGYILAALPALAMWIGEEWTRASVMRLRVAGLIQAAMLLALAPLLRSVPTALAHGITHADFHLGPLGRWLSGKTGLWTAGALLLAWLTWRGRRFAAPLLAAALTTLAVMWLVAAIGPEVDRTASARPIAQAVCGKRFGIDGVSRQMRYSLEFYCDRVMIASTDLDYTLSPDAPDGASAVAEFPAAGLTLWKRGEP